MAPSATLRTTAIVAAALVAASLTLCLRVATAQHAKRNQTITFSQLNSDFTILGIVGEPVGEVVRITGCWKDGQAKPGRYLAIESINGKPADKLVSEVCIDGELPTLKLGLRFSFSALSTHVYRKSDFDPENVYASPFPYSGYYSRLEVIDEKESNRPAKSKPAAGEGVPRGPSPYGPSPLKPKPATGDSVPRGSSQYGPTRSGARSF